MLTVSRLREQAAVQLEVLSAIGQVVQRRQLGVRHGVIQANLLLEPLPAGVYSLRLPTAEGPVVRRLVKEERLLTFFLRSYPGGSPSG